MSVGQGFALGPGTAMLARALLPGWPRIGLGCAALGVMGMPVSDTQARAVIELAWERGIRLFDTAPLYGGGLSEERLGAALAGLPRDAYVLTTKTGVTRPYAQAAVSPGGTRRRAADLWDYSRAGTRSSVARSLERLRTDRLDIVHLHNIEGREDQCMSAHEALVELRAEGVVSGIGIGADEAVPARTLIAKARFDAVLMAGRYTLLDQSALELFRDAQASNIRIVAGGVFNSGILASGAVPGATYGYDPAPPAMLSRVQRLAATCARHGVPLKAAALQFVSTHPAISTLLLGPRSVAELAENLAMLSHPVPAALWTELKELRLIDGESEVPQ